MNPLLFIRGGDFGLASGAIGLSWCNHVADVGRDQNHVEVCEAAELHKALSPLVPLLYFHVGQDLVVYVDKRVKNLQ